MFPHASGVVDAQGEDGARGGRNICSAAVAAHNQLFLREQVEGQPDGYPGDIESGTETALAGQALVGTESSFEYIVAQFRGRFLVGVAGLQVADSVTGKTPARQLLIHSIALGPPSALPSPVISRLAVTDSKAAEYSGRRAYCPVRAPVYPEDSDLKERWMRSRSPVTRG